MIFLSITGSFAAAVIYDKRETSRVRQKWCDLVSPLAEERLAPTVLPRRISVYVEAPPADGLRTAREHFHEYVKPVLVAAAMDWDVVEGRREGDVRYGTAERIRKQRRRQGEGEGQDEDEDAASVVENLRQQIGTQREAGPAGDLIIGRHTWKEYIRGLHEGWLGPVSKPQQVQADVVKDVTQNTFEEPKTHVPGHGSLGDAAASAAVDIAAPILSNSTSSDTEFSPNEPYMDDASPAASTLPTEEAQKEKEDKEKEEKSKRLNKPDAYISTAAYASAQLPSSMQPDLAPTAIVPLPHILGFWKFPFRIWRFLNRRHLADDIGRQTAALILASSRPFDSISEQESALIEEEADWHKNVRKRERSEGEESVWLDDIVFDERISERMRRFQLTQDDEDKAAQLFKQPRIAESQE